MSYCILYKRIFIRTKDERYIVLAQAGDNNVWTTDYKTGREKRSRSWEAWNFNENKFDFSDKEINTWLQERLKIAAERASEDGLSLKQVAEKFGYYKAIAIGGKSTYATTYGMVNNFFSPTKGTVVEFDEFVAAFGGLHISYWTDSYKRTETFTKEKDLRQAFENLKKSTKSTLWITPSYPYSLEDFLNVKFGKSKLSVNMLAVYGDSFSGPIVRYVKSILPLKMTTKKEEAVSVHYSTVEGLFEVISAALKRNGYQLKSLSYQKA